MHIADRYRVPPGVVAEELDGETILLSMDSGIYYGLDAIGTTIWRGLKQGGPLAAVLHELRVAFPTVPSAQIEFDAQRLLAELVEQGLLQLEAGAAP
jgi:Coenzyme PQQ synthesis protein D (PqqD)